MDPLVVVKSSKGYIRKRQRPKQLAKPCPGFWPHRESIAKINYVWK